MMKHEQDGVDHIRIHLNAATELGRMLSEFREKSFTVKGLGEFDHIFGFSLFLRYRHDPDKFMSLTGLHISQLRHTRPFDILRHIRNLDSEWSPPITYNLLQRYDRGVDDYVQSDPKLQQLLSDSELPLLIYRETPGDLGDNYRGVLGSLYTNLRHKLRMSKLTLTLD